MIISEKITMLRKKNDWSQEQLAEQLSVSRQSVSKWESGAAIPGMDLLVKMSELFGVSVDYLVKDEMEEIAYTGEETIERNDDRIVTLEEANTYMDTVREVASKIATGVVLCILSPVLLIFLGGYSETVGAAITENMAGGIGLVALLVIITVAVVTLILNGLKLSKYEYLEKDEISLIYGVKGIVEKKKKRYGKCNTIVIGLFAGKENAFLIQNTFPVIEKYFDHVHTIQEQPVTIHKKLDKVLVENLNEVLAMYNRGIKLTFTDIKAIRNIMEEELGK